MPHIIQLPQVPGINKKNTSLSWWRKITEIMAGEA